MAKEKQAERWMAGGVLWRSINVKQTGPEAGGGDGGGRMGGRLRRSQLLSSRNRRRHRPTAETHLQDGGGGGNIWFDIFAATLKGN
ncbi:Hypothetical predicted protein [Xyrichtys novacula]|uniref:Uncharacterized protein n=1 Tax=Xyrichtys novacula TaxID=13765 RepID=A0AAV1HP79_XYRNO|nr:Hypothetical predicted protein [Xyrichtys novacula]